MTRSREVRRGEAGLTLPEALVAVLLLSLVVAAAAGVISVQTKVAHAQPEVLDVQQRARFAIDSIATALRSAGAGQDYGALPGPLRLYIAPLLPRKIGATGADAWSVARGSAISILSVPSTSVQTSLRDPVSGAAAGVTPRIAGVCLPAVCGLRPDMPLIVFDRRARFDLMSVTAVGVDRADIRLWHPGGVFEYSAGAALTRVDVVIYYFDPASRQIRQSDGDRTDVPLVDNVTDLSFQFFGDPAPPESPQPPLGTANCLYDSVGARHPAVTLSPGSRALVPLSLNMLGDGPWCGSGDLQFDADLLRIRSVRVGVRVQTSSHMRRAIGADYTIAGAGRDASTAVPDFSITVDVAPRNMQGGR